MRRLIADGVLNIPWASLRPDVRAKFSRHEAALAQWGLLENEVLHATWQQWARLGALPQTDEEEFLAHWTTLQDALADALEIEHQAVQVRGVGFVGAAGASVVITVD